jgi:hypothetical protein
MSVDADELSRARMQIVQSAAYFIAMTDGVPTLEARNLQYHLESAMRCMDELLAGRRAGITEPPR